MWKCPECGGDELAVDVVMTARLIQKGPDDFETTDDYWDRDHHWNEDSLMRCLNDDCDFSGDAWEFEDGEETTGDEA
jgi:hypothetical protein